MSKDGSVAPKERVNITYKPATGDHQEEVELPLRILMMGNYTGRPDDTPVEERKPINVDADNFAEVMAEQALSLDLNVPDRLSEDREAQLAVRLRFTHLHDFSPQGVAAQVPELQKLMELRKALTALKGPLGNIPTFRKRIQAILGDPEARHQLMAELSREDGGDDV